MIGINKFELNALRDKLHQQLRRITVKTAATSVTLPTQNDGICEILMDIETRDAHPVSLTLSNKAGEKVVLVYHPADGTLSFDRTQSGIVNFSQDFPSVTTGPIHRHDGKVSLRLFVDRSSIEVFEQEGRLAMTNLVFPTSPYTTLSVSTAKGRAKVSNLKIFALKTSNR